MSNNNSENLDELFPKEPESAEQNVLPGDDSVNFPNDGATSVFKFDEPINVSKYDPNKHSVEAQSKSKPKKKKRRKRNYTAYGGIVIATLVLCVSVLLSLFIIVVGRDVLGIESAGVEFTIYIPSGSTTEDIAQQLYDEGVIQYKDVFKLISKVKGADGSMYPGDLDVAYNMSYSDIIDSLMISREAKQTATVTFPEGITLLSAGKLLEENNICTADEFVYTFNSTAFGFEFEKYVSSSSLKLYKYEGYLFPDTYEFYVGDSAYNVVKKIKSRTNEILNADVIKLAAERGFTIDQVVTLASIVQRESGSIEQMGAIASVFENRLAKPDEFPRLQSDTTYSYIDDVIKKVMTVEYQDMYDAYDTYTCVGLPIGAICNPGKDAIDAVLNPDETAYYYFCSNLETKETFFAATNEEHEENKKKAGLA